MEERYLIAGLKKRDKIIFDFIFHYYYSGLCAFSERITNSQAAAEDIVQEMFVTLWVKHHQLNITSSLKNYLFTAVKNRSLDYLKHEKLKVEKLKNATHESVAVENLSSLWFAEEELKVIVEKSLQKLPPRCREIFELSWINGLKNQEIADMLTLSKRTVELQLSNAFKFLRTELAAIIPLHVILFLFR